MSMSEAEKVEFRMQMAARLVFLFEENQRLKKRLKKRSKMEKHWHKSFMDLYKSTTLKSVADKAKAQALKASTG